MKIKSLQLLQNQSMFTRDSKRLHAKAKAAYQKMGLAVMDEPPDEYVLGNKTSVTNQLLPWATMALLGGGGMMYMVTQDEKAVEDIDQPVPTVQVTDATNTTTVSGGGREEP